MKESLDTRALGNMNINYNFIVRVTMIMLISDHFQKRVINHLCTS